MPMEPGSSLRHGYLLLADVSGYTAFLARSELHSAQDVLRVLLDTLISNVPAPFRVVEVEGDAVFAYAEDRPGLDGTAVLDIAERLYFAFTETRERMEANSECPCVACGELPALDLKIVVHHGSFALSNPLRAKEPKPGGPDVIIAHRLLKNDVRESTGMGAYVLLTDAAVRAGVMHEVAAAMRPHVERHEHLGETSGRVHDLAAAWAAERERRRVTVDPDGAWFMVEADVPAPPAVAWSFHNEPAHKRRWRGLEDVSTLGGPAGRTGVGTLHRCAGGGGVVLEEVVDLRPFEYVTSDAAGPAGARVRTTTRLEPTESGTRLRVVTARPQGSNPWHHHLVVRPASALLKRREKQRVHERLDRLRALIDEEAPAQT